MELKLSADVKISKKKKTWGNCFIVMDWATLFDGNISYSLNILMNHREMKT